MFNGLTRIVEFLSRVEYLKILFLEWNKSIFNIKNISFSGYFNFCSF